MKRDYLRVKLHAPNDERAHLLKAYITKGRSVSRKYLTSNIAAPGNELNKFTAEGVLKEGETAPAWLRMEVALFYAAAVMVARETDAKGELAALSSKELTKRVRDVYCTASPTITLNRHN